MVTLLPSLMILCMSLVGMLMNSARMICLPSSCRVCDLVKLHVSFVHIWDPAQQWFTIQNVEPSPSTRRDHAMASDGTRVFVLGGVSLGFGQGDSTALIHVMDTSTYYLFVISFGQPSYLEAQSTPSIQIPIPTMSSLVRRPLDWRRSHPRGPPPWRKTTMAKVRLSTMRNWRCLMLLLREKLRSQNLSGCCRQRLPH
jgi:hypothetical protein